MVFRWQDLIVEFKSCVSMSGRIPSKMINETPGLSVAIILTQGDKVLFGKRIEKNGSSCWQLPGGWIHKYESPLEAVSRELTEETGLSGNSFRLVAITDNQFENGVHSLTLCFEGVCENPEILQNREPDKCSGWHWRNWNASCSEVFFPLEILQNTGYRPFSESDNPIHVSF